MKKQTNEEITKENLCLIFKRHANQIKLQLLLQLLLLLVLLIILLLVFLLLLLQPPLLLLQIFTSLLTTNYTTTANTINCPVTIIQLYSNSTITVTISNVILLLLQLCPIPTITN